MTDAKALLELADEDLWLDTTHKHHAYLKAGEIPCRSCPSKYPWPSKYIASAKRINDLPPVDWPLCEEHSQAAMVVGWFPFRTINEWRALKARATTGGKHD